MYRRHKAGSAQLSSASCPAAIFWHSSGNVAENIIVWRLSFDGIPCASTMSRIWG